ncbi:MAG: TIGR03118 family protein [Verrucomicrobiota bacterium]|nr:TIGR03118 family protein [Verrucomicrobiota bacterium]
MQTTFCLLGAWAFAGAACLVRAQSAYTQHNLVSDVPGLADITDTNLLNPWGIAFSATGPFRISDNHSGLSTVYDGTGTPQSLVVAIPPPAGGAPPAAPTGIVFNNTTNFIVASNAAAKFIFATEDGTLSAWASGTDAVLKVDNSASSAIYKGLALGSANGSNYLYATDFHDGKVDVFDEEFNPVAWPGAFTDTNIPAGFAPFGIQTIGTNVFVTYAKQDANAEDDVAGPGYGYVDIYDTGGNLVKRFISNGALNSPWGMAVAPANFGLFAGQLLIGNFGDGTINAFDPASGTLVSTLKDTNGAPIAIDGLWGLKFGNGGSGGDTNTLYFTAGIAAGGAVEDHGLFGSLSVAVPSRNPTAANVSVLNYQFNPATANINVNDTVIWTWPSGSFDHNVTSTSNPQSWPASLTENGPYSFTNTFTAAGTYPYECTIHAVSFGMKGTIIVAAPDVPPAALLFSPGSGAVFAAPANVTLRAAAGDTDGSVTNVQFRVGATVLTNQTTVPFSAVAANLAAGNYTLTAIAADNGGLTATNSVDISVVTPTAVTLTNLAATSGSNFQFSYLVNTGLTYIVQMSTNLAAGNWIPVATNTAASNPAVFVDLHATNNPAFYRVGRLPNP